jgi:glycosyltransferase involved in cell wall biosynthesis
MWARMLACLGDVFVVTRSNNRAPIEAAVPLMGERDRLRFIYVDLPPWARFWKRGQRGVRIYYLLWQLAALRAARRIGREQEIDVVWHLTLSNAWLGSVGSLLGGPFVYGPIGGGVGPPWRLLPALGVRGAAYELLRAAARFVGRYLNPLARLAWRGATLILVQNPETEAWIPARHRAKCRQFQHVVVDGLPAEERLPSTAEQTALFAGRLLPWKGCSLALHALTRAPGWSLIVCGDGPDERRLRRLASKLGVEERVRFLGWQPREKVQMLMQNDAALFMLPSLHDDAGWVVVEALAAGLPVLCLDRGGPPLLAGPAGVAVTSRGSSDSVARNLGKQLSDGARPSPTVAKARANCFLLESRLKELVRLLDPIFAG